jgi:Fe2+ transport system protein FeoA
MTAAKKTISLYTARTGQHLKIVLIPRGPVGSQFIRMGIHEGEKVRCLERLPGGTIVLQKHRQQIAVGHELARQIEVMVIPEPEKK